MTYVYLIGEYDRTHTYLHYKIGYSATPNERLATLQVGNRNPLALAAVMIRQHDCAVVESLLHRVCSGYPRRGEWFTLSPYGAAVLAHMFAWGDLLNLAVALEEWREHPDGELWSLGIEEVDGSTTMGALGWAILAHRHGHTDLHVIAGEVAGTDPLTGRVGAIPQYSEAELLATGRRWFPDESPWYCTMPGMVTTFARRDWPGVFTYEPGRLVQPILHYAPEVGVL